MNRPTRVLLKLAVAGAVGVFIARRIPPAVSAQLQFPVGVRLSLLLLVLFSVYWSIASRNSAPTKSSESSWSRQWHLTLVNAAILLLVLPVPGLTRRFLPTSPLLITAGLLIQVAGLLLAVWARRHLGSNWSGEVRIAFQHQLVRSGPYRLLRHPIYTAVLAMYSGIAVVSGQIHAPIALVILILAYWRKIRLEERALRETFGPDFEAYRRDSWALLPLLY